MPKAADAQALKPGTRLDVYDIEEVLGTGGFGITYRARDSTLACNVAVKEYFPSYLACRDADGRTLSPRANEHVDAYGTGMQRFLEEARTLARFKEPGIVRISRLFQANGTAYLVMDYVEGASLEMRLRREGRFDERSVTMILQPLLEGLRALHAQNILHRDIKPANVYIRHDGSPVLLDFGAAREALEGALSSMTLIVTPGYAPMEQYTRDERQGPWSDLYALGATLFHCLVGHPPMAAPDRFSRRVEDRPDPIGQQLRTLDQPLSPPLLELLEDLLAVVISERPQCAEDVLARLPTLNTISGDSRVMDLSGPRSGAAMGIGAGTHSRSAHPPSADAPISGPVPTTRLAVSQLERAALRAGGVLAQRAVVPAMKRADSAEALVEHIAGFIADADSRDEFRRHARVVVKAALHGSQEVTSMVPPSAPAPYLKPSDAPTVFAPASQSPGTQPAAAGPQTIDEAFAGKLEARLAETLGPIARMLVRRAVERAGSHSELVRLLAEELDDPVERSKFTRGLL